MARRAGEIIAVYPGSFDPVTHGHLDVIRRAAGLFNKLIVGVGKNPGKEEMFSSAERLELLDPHVRALRNVTAEAYDGLTIDFVRQCGARVLVKGIRDLTDLSHELQQANVNLTIGGIETVFMLTSDQHVVTSSTYIKQIYEMGGRDAERIKRLVPPNVARRLRRKLGQPRHHRTRRRVRT
jgi:pantetheine-phosphate adenylyltransferase